MKKLIEALHEIQDECRNHRMECDNYDCWNCPMGMENGCCSVTESIPNQWKINDEVQKALL